MYHLFSLLLLLILFCLPSKWVQAQEPGGTATPSSPPETAPIRPTITPVITARPQVAIVEPIPGQALQGKLAILGTSLVEGFQSAELSFSYTNDETATWFLIHASDTPVAAGLLAEWDTSEISDGEYDLRLVVNLTDGKQFSTVTPGLRVRNYTPIETSTPTPLTPTSHVENSAPLAGTLTPTRPLPSPTPLPPNPAQVSGRDLAASFGQGALLTLGAFALGGMYITLRKIQSNR